MDINRNNYMVWISDFYEDTLSDSEKRTLYNFLDLNPDLKEEFEAFDELVLYPDIARRLDKSSLHKNPSDIDSETLEKYAISVSEEDLNPSELEQVEELLYSTPGGESLIAEYKSLKLAPDALVYPDKIKLRRIPLKRRIYIFGLRLTSAAAVIALLITLIIQVPGSRQEYTQYRSANMLPFNTKYPAKSSGEVILSPVLSRNKMLVKDISITDRTAQNNNTEGANAIEREDIIVEPLGLIASVEMDVSENEISLSSIEPLPITTISDSPSGLSPRQFIAMNFRKHILKEDASNTEKLKVYEVADASVVGLNKLLGWEMQFEKEKADDGRLLSYKFTSQLINLDRKVKNVTE